MTYKKHYLSQIPHKPEVPVVILISTIWHNDLISTTPCEKRVYHFRQWKDINTRSKNLISQTQQNRDGFFTCCTCDCSVQETESRLNNHTKELSNKTPSTVNTSRLSSTMMGITTFCFSCPCILLRLEFTKNNEQHKFSPSQLMAELHRIKTDKTGHCQNHTGALCYCFRPHNI